MRKNIALLTEEELNNIENSKINIEADEVLEESAWWAAGIAIGAAGAFAFPGKAY